MRAGVRPKKGTRFPPFQFPEPIDADFDADQSIWANNLIAHLENGGTLETTPDFDWSHDGTFFGEGKPRKWSEDSWKLYEEERNVERKILQEELAIAQRGQIARYKQEQNRFLETDEQRERRLAENVRRAADRKLKREIAEREEQRLYEWREREDRRIAERFFDRFFEQIMEFPHATPAIASQTAREYLDFGRGNATQRGIDGNAWLWKRSRWLAGFK